MSKIEDLHDRMREFDGYGNEDPKIDFEVEVRKFRESDFPVYCGLVRTAMDNPKLRGYFFGSGFHHYLPEYEAASEPLKVFSHNRPEMIGQLFLDILYAGGLRPKDPYDGGDLYKYVEVTPTEFDELAMRIGRYEAASTTRKGLVRAALGNKYLKDHMTESALYSEFLHYKD